MKLEMKKNSMINIIRTLFRINSPLVSKTDALRFVAEHCARNGIQTKDPKVHEKLKEWRVLTNGDSMSSRYFIVDNQTGEIVREGQSLR